MLSNTISPPTRFPPRATHGTLTDVTEPPRTRSALDVFRYLDYRAYLRDLYTQQNARGLSYQPDRSGEDRADEATGWSCSAAGACEQVGF
jgi:hypothetical protein